MSRIPAGGFFFFENDGCVMLLFGNLVTVRGVYGREWCQCRSETLMDHGARERHTHRRIRGPGESMARNQSRALLFRGILFFLFYPIDIANWYFIYLLLLY